MATAAAREQRVRLPLEVLRRGAPHASARDFPVGCRFLAEECIEGGSDVAGRRVLRGRSSRRPGCDFISLSRGGKFDDARQPKVGAAAYPYTGPQRLRMHALLLLRRARSLRPQSRADRAHPRAACAPAGYATPVVAAGGIHNFRAGRGGARGGRGGHRRLRAPGARRSGLVLEGPRGDAAAEVRLCMYTNYCEALDQRHRQVTCELWDREGLDPIEPASPCRRTENAA